MNIINKQTKSPIIIHIGEQRKKKKNEKQKARSFSSAIRFSVVNRILEQCCIPFSKFNAFQKIKKN